MIRMSLVTEMLVDLVSSRAGPDRYSADMAKLQVDTTEAIHINEKNWYRSFIPALAELQQDSPANVAKRARRAIAGSDSIRYVQLGNPDLILVDDGSISSDVMEQYGAPQEEAALSKAQPRSDRWGMQDE